LLLVRGVFQSTVFQPAPPLPAAAAARGRAAAPSCLSALADSNADNPRLCSASLRAAASKETHPRREPATHRKPIITRIAVIITIIIIMRLKATNSKRKHMQTPNLRELRCKQLLHCVILRFESVPMKVLRLHVILDRGGRGRAERRRAQRVVAPGVSRAGAAEDDSRVRVALLQPRESGGDLGESARSLGEVCAAVHHKQVDVER